MNSSTTIKAILVDIEGTTSSINFVHEVLFPYARSKLSSFIKNNITKAEVKKIISEAFEIEGLEASDQDIRIEKSIKLFEKWIIEDKKIKPLKDLQGMIWESGYRNKDFFGHVYEDAYQTLLEWHGSGLKIFIYSSGSINAQKLLFGHSSYGDLNYLFSGNFDTQIGSKKEFESYRKITEAIKLKASEIMFLSDNSDELKAAKESGMNVIKLARPEDKIESDIKYLSVKNFLEINF
jgi:enolase-phosphatase E1